MVVIYSNSLVDLCSETKHGGKCIRVHVPEYQKARTSSVRKILAGMLTLNVSLLAINNCNKTRLSIIETTYLKYCQHHVSVTPLCSKELKSQNYQSLLMF